MKKHKNSSQGKFEFVLLKKWSLPVFKQPGVYYPTGTQKKINSFSVHGYCNRFKTLLEQWDIIFFSVLVKKLDLALLITISNEEPRKEVWTRLEKTTFEKKDSSKKKHGSLVGGMKF